MPQQAIDSMKVDKIVKATEMAVLINGLNG
jgi:hypothetical protein